MNTKKRLTRTAYHEAGHAVIQIKLDIGVKKVTIVPNPKTDTLGYSRQASKPPSEGAAQWRRDSYWLRLAVVFYAGREAEKRAGYKNWRRGSETDERMAGDLMYEITAGADLQARSLFFELAERRAFVLVKLHWVEIEAVAKALLTEKTLTGDQVKTAPRKWRGLHRRWQNKQLCRQRNLP